MKTLSYNYYEVLAKLKSSIIDPLKLISEFQNLDLKECDDKLITKLIKKLGKFGMIEQVVYAGEHSFLERARPNYNGEVFTRFNQISYNSNPSTSFKRCTIPGEIVFYGTLPTLEIEQVRLAAVTETSEILENNTGGLLEEKMTIVRWQIIKDLKCAALIGKDEFIKHNSELSNIRKTLFEFVSFHPNPKEVENTFRINEFLASEFGKKVNKSEEYEYKISAFFSDFVFKQGFDGIIYPAVSLGGAGMNIALRKDIIDNNYIKPILALQINNYSLGKNFISDNPYIGEFNGDIINCKDSPYSSYAGRAACLRELFSM